MRVGLVTRKVVLYHRSRLSRSKNIIRFILHVKLVPQAMLLGDQGTQLSDDGNDYFSGKVDKVRVRRSINFDSGRGRRMGSNNPQ